MQTTINADFVVVDVIKLFSQSQTNELEFTCQDKERERERERETDRQTERDTLDRDRNKAKEN